MLPTVKTDEQRRARELRAEGRSVKEIERALGVARSSVSRWVRDVPLGEAQRRRLCERSKRANKLPYGTCKLVGHSTQIVQTIYGSIQEYGGFDRPEWLD
jgi:predicted transcriptional regulator